MYNVSDYSAPEALTHPVCCGICFFPWPKKKGLSKSNDDAPFIAVAYYAGDAGRALETLANDKAVEHTMTILQRLFGVDAASVPSVVWSEVTRWVDEEYSRGSYSSLPPGMQRRPAFVVLYCGGG